jgi:hypothetical protein
MRPAPPIGHPPYNKNGEGGRPKRYTDEYVNQLADELLEWQKGKDNIFIEEFCYDRNIPESEVADTLNKHARFSEAYKQLKIKQKLSLFKGGLNRKHYYPMCALLLNVNHGIKDVKDQNINVTSNRSFTTMISEIEGDSKDLVNG